MATKDVERKTLVMLLAINGAMFVIELVVGWIAQSMGLIADSLDMLADAGVYTAALWAVGSTTRRKTHAALASGVLQVALAIGVAQVVQAAPTSLRISVRLATGADADTVWRAVHGEVTRVLAERGLRHVIVERGDEVPEQSAGGKCRQIIPLM